MAEIIQWHDDEGCTQEILEAMMIVIQLWEEKNGPIRVADPIRELDERPTNS